MISNVLHRNWYEIFYFNTLRIVYFLLTDLRKKTWSFIRLYLKAWHFLWRSIAFFVIILLRAETRCSFIAFFCFTEITCALAQIIYFNTIQHNHRVCMQFFNISQVLFFSFLYRISLNWFHFEKTLAILLFYRFRSLFLKWLGSSKVFWNSKKILWGALFSFKLRFLHI